MNDTIDENRLALLRLVFGTIPRLPILTANLSRQEERMEACGMARTETITFVTQRRVFEI